MTHKADTSNNTPSFMLQTSLLSARKPTYFDIQFDAQTCRDLATDLGLMALEKLHLKGMIIPHGRRDFRLEAQLYARITQACRRTLAPVRADIDEKIERLYLADYAPPTNADIEVGEDGDPEPLPEVFDLREITQEALTLALPPYPLASEEDEPLLVVSGAPPGAAPLDDTAQNPFSSLASLRDAFDKKERP